MTPVTCSWSVRAASLALAGSMSVPVRTPSAPRSGRGTRTGRSGTLTSGTKEATPCSPELLRGCVAVVPVGTIRSCCSDKTNRAEDIATSYVADVKLLQSGESAGYGRRFIAAEPTWIGPAPAGHADAFLETLPGQADVLVRGRRRRVAATISMDQLHLRRIGSGSATSSWEYSVTRTAATGSEAVTAEEWAQLAGTINYEVVTGLEPRPWRVYDVFTGG